MTWSRLEAEAPELARLGGGLLARRVAYLGTVRADGSPRVSAVEPFLVEGELVLGLMRRSAKAEDVRRDVRVALQSAVAEPDGGVPELKLYGRLEPSRAAGGWWRERPDDADVYALAIDEAVAIEWDLAASTMRVRRWRPGDRETVVERAYP